MSTYLRDKDMSNAMHRSSIIYHLKALTYLILTI